MYFSIFSTLGNGGSTMATLEFLESKYGKQMFSMKILLIHAGGWSQRLPSGTVLGKIFSVLPYGTPPFQMLDLKLALYWPFVPRMSPGMFLVCADDFLVFNLGNAHDDWAIPEKGFTALAHPATIDIGRTHGVFVISQEEKSKMETSKHVQLLECVEVLQKPSDERMKSQGALLEGCLHQFADGIFLEGDVVYTDSCFYFGVDVMEKLLSFKKSIGDLKCEIDAYGDFLQAVGKNATSDYVHNISNVSQPTDNLINMRKQVFNTLNGCDVHVLALNASAFIHIGTTKELLHHLCRDEDFQKQMSFDRDVFNSWSGSASSSKINSVAEKDIETDAKIAELNHNENFVSKNSCIVHSSFAYSSTISDDCFLEFCDFDIPVHVSKNCILSNCQLSQSQTQSLKLDIPENIFLHTVPIHPKGADDIEYVTIFFSLNDNLKKTISQKDLESLPFLQSNIGNYLKNQSLSAKDIMPHDMVQTAQLSNEVTNTNGESKMTGRISLWRLKLFRAYSSMTTSLEEALICLSQERSIGGKKQKLLAKLHSLEDIVKFKDVETMLCYRAKLHTKIAQ